MIIIQPVQLSSLELQTTVEFQTRLDVVCLYAMLANNQVRGILFILHIATCSKGH